MSDYLAAALDYARRGWCVLPLYNVTAGAVRAANPTCDSAGKHPRTKHGVKDATTDAHVIRAWWRRWPDANVGVATGAASGVIALDVDPRHGGDDSLADLELAHGALPGTPRALTGGGGEHIYLAPPAAHVPCSAGVLGPGLDMRGDGGYVVAPPSLHASGRRYAWEVGASLEDVPVAPAPGWLVARLPRGRSYSEARPPDEWAALVHAGADAGRRNDAVARLAGYLLRCRPAPRVVLELILAWNASRCRPPLADGEIIATVDSIARREAMRRRERGG